MNNKTGIKHLNLADLNEDVQFLILENLDFDDLLSVSETNQYFSSLALVIFRKKYSHKIFEIKSAGSRYPDDMGRIYMRDEDRARRILKQFGQFIYKLKVNYEESLNFDKTTIEAMSRLINSYCTDALTEIVVYDKRHSFFGQITKPFRNVKNVELYGHFKNVSSGLLTINEIFPAIESLFLSSTTFKYVDQIEQKYPNLIELSVNFYDSVRSRNFKESTIEQILRLNPQIRILKMHSPTENILRVANEVLPYLERLRIETALHLEIFNTGPMISFKNVRILELKPFENTRNNHRFLEGIEFENLEELRAMITHVPGFDWWIDFIQKNTYLSKFHTIDGCVHKIDLEKMTKIDKMTLNDISMGLCYDVEHKNLVKFVSENQNVRKFHFKFHKEDDEYFEMHVSEMQKNFNKNWIITNTTDSIDLEKVLT